jgi:hypothetical protein
VAEPTKNERKLMEIAFQLVGTVSDPLHAPVFNKMTHAQRMEWAARQLNECGFKNTPVGASWGYLTQSPD